VLGHLALVGELAPLREVPLHQHAPACLHIYIYTFTNFFVSGDTSSTVAPEAALGPEPARSLLA
jgi:hypothetical protein